MVASSSAYEDRGVLALDFPSLGRHLWIDIVTRSEDGSLLVSKLLVDGANLLLDVDILHMAELCLCLDVWVAVEAVDGGLLPTGKLILGQGLAGDRVEDIASLAGEALEIVGHIDVG